MKYDRLTISIEPMVNKQLHFIDLVENGVTSRTLGKTIEKALSEYIENHKENAIEVFTKQWGFKLPEIYKKVIE